MEHQKQVDEQERVNPEEQQIQSDKGNEDYRPCIEENKDKRIFDNSISVSAELMTIDQCETLREMCDNQLVGPPSTTTIAMADVTMVDVEVRTAAAANVIDMSKVKRKRGRPPKIQGKTGPPIPPTKLNKRDEEDVCFICFDGGNLVLCDRRGCPKAYHPTCIKRDDAFFRSKAKWNCGWHICSGCQKASQYMCYTCTYSSCKGCIKGADYVGVRGNKGFCGTCLKTIMLIENITLANTERVQVDFDDKTSWEYLFKVYWIYLKDKLSLTIDELTNAKNPWKADNLPKANTSWKGAGIVVPKEVSSGELYHGNDEKVSCSDRCFGNVEENHCKRRKTKDQPNFIDDKSLVVEKSGVDKVAQFPEGIAWATKELLALVAHMKNGDTSVLSQFDVQALLEEYVRKNNLRDPRHKAQIICDSRLATLFGKPCVDHFEMLKLLDNHFLIKEKSPADENGTMGVVDNVGGQVEATRSIEGQLMVGDDRLCKTRKKLDDGSQINPNANEYAAIDVHNINLIYLKHNLMETLMDDSEKFHEKVAGSFVRIRIPGGDQKPDLHRLVEVVGTSKVAESYTVGSRITDVMLEILNLNKKETVSINVISNQEFSEEECRHLCMSIKRGVIKELKVGEIQEKAMALHPIKVSDGLEAEVSRLNHLRDQASEKGHRKELRECTEKLELLKSPEELQRRLLEIPSIHVDPNMSPSCRYEEDAGESSENKQGDNMRPSNTGVGRKGTDLNSPLKEDLNDVGNKAQISFAAACEQSRNTNTYVAGDNTNERVSESTWSQRGGPLGLNSDALGLNSEHASKHLGSVKGDWNSQTEVQSESLSGVESAVIPPPLSSGGEQCGCDFETEKLWHYEDPFGNIEGPFSIMELRKWSTGGLFPLNFRVWRINEKQDDSILLTDAMGGVLPKHPLQPSNSHLLPHEATVSSNDTGKRWENGLIHDSKSVRNDARVSGVVDSDIMRCNNGLGSHSSTWTKNLDVAMTNDAQAQSSLQGWELSNDGKSWAGQTQIWGSLPSTSSSSKLFESMSLKVREAHGDSKLSSNPSNGDSNSHRNTDGSTNLKGRFEKGERADSGGQSIQSSGQSWRPQPINSSQSGWDSNSGLASVSKSIDRYEQNQEIDFSDLLSPKPKQSHRNLKGQTAENKSSVTSNVPVKDSGPSWSTTSSLVVSGPELPEVAGEWGGYPTHIKSSVEEWDPNILSASSLKPTNGGSDHAATPTSGTDPLAHSSPTNPIIDASSWQTIVSEQNEFSLVDESVSDLLAEVEAMESLGGLPSPTSKISCGGELTPGSDNDCFSPAEQFSPVPGPGKSDAFSSTGDVQMPTQLPVADVVLRLSHTPSQMPSHLTVADKPHQLNEMPRRSIAEMPSKSTLTEGPLGLWQTGGLDAQKSFSGHSSSSAEVIGDDTKPSNISANQWKIRSEIEPLASSTVDQGEAGTNIRARTSSSVGQWEAGSVVQRPASSTAYAGYGTVKGNANSNRGVSQGNTSTIWGTVHGSVEQQASSNSAISSGNPGILGSQPRYGGDNRYSSPRDHRNHFQGRDSGFGRDRSSWNRQPAYGAGNGGSFKQPGKGQRVCKFYENGYCKRGASCSYFHP